MNNFKKIGMTALAASLVSTSVFAGEMTVTGSASITQKVTLLQEWIQEHLSHGKSTYVFWFR